MQNASICNVRRFKLRSLILLSLSIFLLSVSAHAETLDFSFADANDTQYRTTQLLDQLEKKYNYRYNWMSIILIETPSVADSDYKEQKSILNSLGDEAETLQLMYVVSCWNHEAKFGYHTSRETAKDLAGDNEKFRVRVLNVHGKILETSNQLLTADDIRTIVTTKNRAAPGQRNEADKE